MTAQFVTGLIGGASLGALIWTLSPGLSQQRRALAGLFAAIVVICIIRSIAGSIQ